MEVWSVFSMATVVQTMLCSGSYLLTLQILLTNGINIMLVSVMDMIWCNIFNIWCSVFKFMVSVEECVIVVSWRVFSELVCGRNRLSDVS